MSVEFGPQFRHLAALSMQVPVAVVEVFRVSAFRRRRGDWLDPCGQQVACQSRVS